MSTGVALAHFSDTILDNMDKGSVTGTVFLDLTKAFDTVDHQRLIHKLYSTGFSNHSVEWFKSYLANRCQVTAVENAHSSTKLVPVGVPQGSILGPLLFLIYVNDLTSCLQQCDLTLYADDTGYLHFSKGCCYPGGPAKYRSTGNQQVVFSP